MAIPEKLRLLVVLMTLAIMTPAASFVVQPGAPLPRAAALASLLGRCPRDACGSSRAAAGASTGRPGSVSRVQWAMSAAAANAGGEGAGAGGERERGGAGVAVLTKPPITETVTKAKEKVGFEGSWRVMLHRDEWDTLDYGAAAIVMVVPTITRKKAHQIMMHAHMTGIATVTVAPKPLARHFSKGFLKLGFTSSIVPNPSETC